GGRMVSEHVTVKATHNWMMVCMWRNDSGTSDRIDFCENCGVVRKSSFHKSGEQDSPAYFGVGVPFSTIDTPACIRRHVSPAPARDEVRERIVRVLVDTTVIRELNGSRVA